jgi:hypothetical protein
LQFLANNRKTIDVCKFSTAKSKPYCNVTWENWDEVQPSPDTQEAVQSRRIYKKTREPKYVMRFLVYLLVPALMAFWINGRPDTIFG